MIDDVLIDLIIDEGIIEVIVEPSGPRGPSMIQFIDAMNKCWLNDSIIKSILKSSIIDPQIE